MWIDDSSFQSNTAFMLRSNLKALFWRQSLAPVGFIYMLFCLTSCADLPEELRTLQATAASSSVSHRFGKCLKVQAPALWSEFDTCRLYYQNGKCFVYVWWFTGGCQAGGTVELDSKKHRITSCDRENLTFFVHLIVASLHTATGKMCL